MTVHGAKGLEAPIVFLPDTCSTRSGRPPRQPARARRRGAPGRRAGAVRVAGQGHRRASAPMQQAKAASRAPRPRSATGCSTWPDARARPAVRGGLRGQATAPPPDCWYNLDPRRHSPTDAEEVTTRTAASCGASRAADRQAETGRHTSSAARRPQPSAGLGQPAGAAASRCPVPLAPSRLAPSLDSEGEPSEHRPVRAARERDEPRRRSCRSPALAEDAAASCAARSRTRCWSICRRCRKRGWASRRGGLRRPAAAQRCRRRRARASSRRRWRPARAGVRAPVRPRAAAEVAIVAEIPHPDAARGPAAAARRQDRPAGRDLDERVLIVDYKTNRPPPACRSRLRRPTSSACGLPPGAAAKLSRAAAVRAAILWTDGPRIMEIPARHARRSHSAALGARLGRALTPEGAIPTFPQRTIAEFAAPGAPHQRRLLQWQADTYPTPHFEQEVLKSSEPVLVDFFAEWCGPCKAMAPALEQVAHEMKGKVKVAKLDVDQNPDVTGKYGIRAMPTLMISRAVRLQPSTSARWCRRRSSRTGSTRPRWLRLITAMKELKAKAPSSKGGAFAIDREAADVD